MSGKIRRLARAGGTLAAVLAASVFFASGLTQAVEARAQTPEPGAPAPAGAPDTAGEPSDPSAIPDVGTSLGTPQAGRLFAAETGAILSPIRADKVKDFELVIARIHEALSRSTDAVRLKQAEGWKVYRAAEPGPAGSVLFVSVMSPSVKGADYSLGKILLEAFPLEDAQELFEQYLAAFAGTQTLLNLRLAVDFAQPWTPAVPSRK